MVLRDTVGQVAVRLSTERPPSKDELVSADAKGPPINGICVSTLREDFWCHVRHGSCDSCQQTLLRVVYSDIEVSYMGMTTLVQEDVIRFKVPDGRDVVYQRMSNGDCSKRTCGLCACRVARQVLSRFQRRRSGRCPQ